jgi:hypothetical protein
MVIYVARRPVGFVMQMDLKRQALKQRHGAWAEYLGMDRSLWYLLRRGDKELSLAVIQRVLQEWPDEFEPFLKDAVLSWREVSHVETTPGDRPAPRKEGQREGA